MPNRDIAVLVAPHIPDYENYVKFIKPYLDHFGFPYTEVEGDALPDCALILVAHAGVKLSSDAVDAVKNHGVGLVCFNSNALPESWLKQGHDGVAGNINFLDCSHYITALHKCGESIPLYKKHEIMCGMSLKEGEVLVTADGIPLLEVDSTRGGKVVLWQDCGWMSHAVLGPIHGMDDLVWRSIVWAAKKPFVLQGMPYFIGMRVDDVWGAWREINPENPLVWVDIANEYGIIPWLGLFQDNMDDATIAKVRQLVADGKATAFPHAFAGCDWVPTTLPEHWAHFDHHAKKPYSDEVMAENAARIKTWYKENGIPISKYALAHYYETGSNAIPHLIDMGCEFIGVHMQPDTPYLPGNWIKAGPYRKYEDGDFRESRPVYYGDYLDVENAPEHSGKLFNCVTEIRDISGYEWHPTSDVNQTVDRGIRHLRRAFDSMVPAAFFTHESCWIQRMSPKTWRESLDAILKAVEGYEPQFMSMDDICAYARAKHDTSITCAELDAEGKLNVTVEGKSDIKTSLFVFRDAENGEIAKTLADIPPVNGKTNIKI